MKKTDSGPTFNFEKTLTERDGFKYVVGVDEAGRGPGAGPVVACALYIPEDKAKSLLGRIRDSKKMSKKKRDELYVVLATSYEYGIGIVDNNTIDEINILEATKVAMAEAVSKLPKADYALIDGNMKFSNIDIPYESIVKGDDKCLSISAASVIAKVTRDRIMDKYHEEYPQYGWNTNKGYLSKKHIEAIQEFGTTKYHRMYIKKVGKW